MSQTTASAKPISPLRRRMIEDIEVVGRSSTPMFAIGDSEVAPAEVVGQSGGVG